MNESFRNYLQQGQQAGLRYGIGSPRRVKQGLYGNQLGNRAGNSLEFMDHRYYLPGDDLRHIDWNAYARSDKLTVKLFRDEVNPYLDIIIDGSASMALAGSDKARATLGLAALFAQAGHNGHYTIATWQVHETCQPVPQGHDNPLNWQGIHLDGRDGCYDSFHRQRPGWKSRSVRLLISDLLWEGSPEGTLRCLADSSSAVFVVQLLARADVDPPAHGSIRLEDCETGRSRDLFVDTASQTGYRNRLARHQDQWRRAARQAGVVMATLIAEDVVRQWTLSELIRQEMIHLL